MSCDAEALTEYLDGELTPERRAAVASHLADCPGCRATLDRLRAASAAFKEHARVKAPPALAEKALERPLRETRGREFRWAPAALSGVLAVGVLLVSGKMFKPQVSGIFNQIMGMVSGAASTVGSDAPPPPPPPPSAPSLAWPLLWALLAAAAGVALWRRRSAAPGAHQGRAKAPVDRVAVALLVCFLAFLATSAVMFRPSLAAIFDQVLGMISAAATTVGSGG